MQKPSRNFLLPTIGSAGDVHPVIALGLALQARGHTATVLTNPLFQPFIERLGLGFLPVGTVGEARAIMADPNLWHAQKGFALVAQLAMLPALRQVFHLIEKHADANTVVAASGICFGARLAQEKLGVPMASVHLQPSIIRSLEDQGMAGNVRISAAQPKWFKRAFFRLADWGLIDRHLKRPINTFRAEIGLAPVERVLQRWVHSPQMVIGFFPEWFAKPQSDWPANTHMVGFPLWDGGGLMPLPPEAEEFLNAGEPPIIFTPGSAGGTMHQYFKTSVAATQQLGLRAMLVTNFPEQVPAQLPIGVKAFGYLPFHEVLPRARLLVHHGGIGTMAQAIQAGIPQLVVPNAHDQFDNGWRVKQLGLGHSLPQTRYQPGSATAAIRSLLTDDALPKRCREYAGRIDANGALTKACTLLESLRARP